jgi:hypothetical protein
MTLPELLQAFSAKGISVKKQGNYYMAKCPVHKEQHASLSLGDRGGKGVANCMVCRGNMTPKEFWKQLMIELQVPLETKGSPAKVEKAMFYYEDEKGVPLFVSVKFPRADGKKGFYQCKVSPSRSEILNDEGKRTLGDARKVLYRLPQLIKGIANKSRVWIVEGEKDVHALESIGEVATTKPCGASSEWLPEWSEMFRGIDVTIIQDRDNPGRGCGQKVFDSLKSYAASVTLMESATTGEGDDVSDHIASGFKLDQLVMIDQSKKIGIPVRFASEITRRTQSFLMDSFIPKGVITLIDAEGESGKTTFSGDLIARLSSGQPIPTAGVIPPMNCWWLTAEDDAECRIQPALEAAGANLAKVIVEDAWDGSFDKAGLALCDEVIGDYKVEFWYCDPLWAFLAGAQQSSSPTDGGVRKALTGLKKILQKHNCSLLGARHVTKSNAEVRKKGIAVAASNVGYGPVDIFNAARSVMTLHQNAEMSNDDRTVVTLAHIKCNVAKKSLPLTFEIIDGGDVPRMRWLVSGFTKAYQSDDVVKDLAAMTRSGKQLVEDSFISLMRTRGASVDCIKHVLTLPQVMREKGNIWIDPYFEGL